MAQNSTARPHRQRTATSAATLNLRSSASLSQADRQAVLDAIDTVRQKLPFLIDLSPDERRSLPRMGDKSCGFVSQALEVAEQNPDILPRSFDVAEMRKDVELLSALSTA